jgi:enoyl-CoA hydratase/carnithine racemase
MEMVMTETEGAIGVITLNRPDKLNALSVPMREQIAAAVRQMMADESVRVVIITGGDKVFAAGADLNLLAEKNSREMADLNMGQYWEPLARAPKPVIAAVSGYALGGGCEVALMCDIIVADSTARFGLPEAGVGIMPGAGGTQRMVRALGKYVTSQLAMTGGQLSGDRAYQLGLVSELAEDGQTLDAARKLAGKIARMPPRAIAAIKRSLADGADLPLNAGLALEGREFLLLFDTEDKAEGMQAFLEKRKPEFTGR